MKKSIVILGLVILIASCNSNESKIRSGIKKYIEENANDPSSYEFVDLKIIDTVTVGELNEREVEEIKDDLKNGRSDIAIQNNIINMFPSLPNDDSKLIIKMSEDRIVVLEKKLEINKKDFSNKEIVGYVVKHKYRQNNLSGALQLIEGFVEIDSEFKFLEMGEKLDYGIFYLLK
jgi:hypothetical protein